MGKGIRYKLLKDDYKCKYYLVETDDINRAQKAILKHYKDKQFNSMEIECLVEKGSSPNIIDWKVPFDGTIIKVNLKE